MKKVTSAGTILIDMLLRPLDHLPRPGNPVSLDSVDLMLGGCSVNATVDMARMGMDVSFTCAVGGDRMGDLAKALLAAENISKCNVKVYPDELTLLSVVCIDSTGERNFMGRKGQRNCLSFEDIDLSYIDEADILFCGDMTAMLNLEGPAREKLYRYAKEKGKIVIGDTYVPRDNVWMPKIEACLPYMDYFLPSIGEATPICDGETDPHKILDILASHGVKNVVVKLGADGCVLRTEDGAHYEIPAYKIDPVVDTTGAGDSFCAGFTAGIVNGYDEVSCCKIGAAVGAHCCMAVGASTGMVPFEKILDFIKERGDTLHKKA